MHEGNEVQAQAVYLLNANFLDKSLKSKYIHHYWCRLGALCGLSHA